MKFIAYLIACWGLCITKCLNPRQVWLMVVLISGVLPPARMGVYMGVFNLFIVIPNIVASLTFQPLVKHVFHNNPLYVVMMGGACLLLAAASVSIVQDVTHTADVGTVLASDRHELLSTQGSAQPVPSTGLIDEPATDPTSKKT